MPRTFTTDSIEQVLSEPPARRRFYETVQKSVSAPEDSGADVTLWVEVKTKGARDITRVADWKASDLYAYSESSLIPFWDLMADIRSTILELGNYCVEDIEFEIKGVALWAQVGRLADFTGVSRSHDELIASFLCLATGTNADLDEQKVAGLKLAFGLIGNRVTVPDDVLDSVYDALETAGFDLNLSMQSATWDGRATGGE